MITIIRTTAGHSDFVELVRRLDADLAIRDGADHNFYHQFNSIASIKHAIVAYDGNTPAGCGAVKPYDAGTMEVKRMYTLPAYRGKGIASQILHSLEQWAKELGYSKCILETGQKQPEAIALYRKQAYRQIPNYGQYAGVENSICFEKDLG